MRELHKVDGAAAHRARLFISLPFLSSCKRGFFLRSIVLVCACACVCVNVHIRPSNVYIHILRNAKCEMKCIFVASTHNLFAQSILVRFVWKLEMAKCRMPNTVSKTKRNFYRAHSALARFMESKRIADHQEIHDSFYSFHLRLFMHCSFIICFSFAFDFVCFGVGCRLLVSPFIFGCNVISLLLFFFFSLFTLIL